MRIRLLVPLLGAFALVVSSCSKPKPKPTPTPTCGSGTVESIEQDCACQQMSDCPALDGVVWACTASHQCQPNCVVSQCSAVAAVCPATCQPKGCGEDSECIDGYQCIAGACAPPVTASSVATCAVLPATGLLSPTGTKRFWTIAYDSAGNTLPYEENVSGSTVTWGVAGGLDATASTTEPVTGFVYKGGSALFTGGGTLTRSTTGTVTAKIGSTVCTPSTVTEYAPATQGDLRVVVIDSSTEAPISGATVIINSASPVTTGSDGTVSVTSPGATNTISAFMQNYAYATVVGTSATDVLIPVQPTPAPGTFTSATIASSAFANFSNTSGTVHVQLDGASIAGNLNDVTLPAVLGSRVETNVDIGTLDEGIGLPAGMLLGVGSTMFKDTYTVTASPGTRAFWSMAGNMLLTDVTTAIGNDDNTGDFAQTIAQLLPFTSGFETGVESGVKVTANQTGMIGSGQAVSTPLNTPETLNVVYNMPALPTYLSAASATLAYDEALVITGAFAGPEGLVPLSFSGGTSSTPGGLPGVPGGTAGNVPAGLAPRSGGIEPFPHEVLALATSQASYNGLFGLDEAFVLSGTVILPGDMPTTSTPQQVSIPAFLSVPNGMTLTEATRTLSVPTPVSGVAVQRLDIGDAAQGGLLWSIWFAGSATSATVPAAPDGFNDWFPYAESSVQSLSLSLTTPETFDGLFQFDGIDANHLTPILDRFSVRWIQQQ